MRSYKALMREIPSAKIIDITYTILTKLNIIFVTSIKQYIDFITTH